MLRPALAEIEARHGRLADGLGLSGVRRMTRMTLPLLRRPLGFAAGLAAALSMGDLGVITLFADPTSSTLPLEIYRLMGAYRQAEAAAAALLLVTLSFGLFLVLDQWGRRAET
jgi:thiamine transport system permease protein